MNKNIINSNYLDVNGLQITEGAKVYRTDPDNYRNDGVFFVDSYAGECVKLIRSDGTKPNYNLASPCELRVLLN